MSPHQAKHLLVSLNREPLSTALLLWKEPSDFCFGECINDADRELTHRLFLAAYQDFTLSKGFWLSLRAQTALLF